MPLLTSAAPVAFRRKIHFLAESAPTVPSAPICRATLVRVRRNPRLRSAVPRLLIASQKDSATITEYGLLIFAAMKEHSEQRELQRKKTLSVIKKGLPFAYGLVSLLLMASTGFTPWSSSFWLVFGPFLGAVELALWELFRS